MALRFLQQASDNGYPAASALIGKVIVQNALGVFNLPAFLHVHVMQIFTEGSNDVPKDYVKAMQYFEKAADQVRSYIHFQT